jgi:hypothetical protein
MKQQEEEKKMNVKELSSEELQNTFGGAWWEVRFIDGEIWFLFHLYD